MAADGNFTLELRSIGSAPDEDGVEAVRLHTDAGTIDCRYHAGGPGEAAVLWVFGAGGGLGGPAGGLYTRLAKRLAPEGIASLRLDYRRPAELVPCVLDVLMGIGYLGTRGRSRVVLVGHSFGGAVVIASGALSEAVIGVAALSSQTAGADAVADLSPRPLLLMHGTDDEILPDLCSRDLYRRAGEPRRLLLYEGCRHGLDQCRDEIDRDLGEWILDLAGRGAADG
ncbi:alpha/beta hydrolase [Caldimonas tepidiphila]|uniref:alpha/beta hydrolase n=1 Tax=Caldimonas tepidiphila TaxID=2315841 RepID=UPI000E5A90A4|nr:alpha/beta hydrolase [Caldimonas tepidiphila]